MKESQGLLNPHRLRKIPRHYSWLDHRLIHKGYLKEISAEASSLYLFLVCVGDQQGLSYYSDGAIKKRLPGSGRGSTQRDFNQSLIMTATIILIILH